MNKVLMAMSGGVDSTAAAIILKNQGYNVVGATLHLIDSDNTDRDIQDSIKVANEIGIPHHIIDLREYFSKTVIDYFKEEYINGRTPNPCIICNKFIKFGKLLEIANELGCTYLATGHYARIVNENGSYYVKKGIDKSKDQSYVLYSIEKELLKHILFPISNMTKSEIRHLLTDNNISIADKPDSQDICFVQDGNYSEYLRNNLKVNSEPGNYLDTNGNILGMHTGIIDYTIGQRKGLGVTFGEPRFVISKSASDNTVILGKNEDLFKNEVIISNVNLIYYNNITEPITATAKIRYSQSETECEVIPTKGKKLLLRFKNSVRAPSPGQSAVLYQGDYLIGGGIIE